MQRMSGLDASFLYLETPNMPMHVGLVALFDPRHAAHGYDFARLYRLIEKKTHAEPALRRRLVEVPMGIDHPRWREDPGFDVLHHVRRTHCAAPGGLPQLAQLAARIMGSQLDRQRPLWEVWVVEGLEHGRYALIAKVHHAISDGMGGAQLLSTILSPQSTVTPLRPSPPADAEPEPDELELLRDAISSRIANPQGLLAMVRRTSSALYGFYERRRQDQRRAGGNFLDAPRMPWNAPIDAERSVAFARVEVADVRLIRKAFRVTGNEIVLALCAGALRAYLHERGELPYAPLIAACPVAVRHQTQGDNRISAMVTSLATNIVDPVARLSAIAEIARKAKAEHDALGGDLLANWAELALPAVFHPLARAYSRYRVADWHRPLYNLAISNVPGPRKALFFDGAELVQAYPLGPVIEGVGLNITVMSYVDHLGFGLVAARKRLPDVDQLARCLDQARAELIGAAKASAGTRAVEKKGA